MVSIVADATDRFRCFEDRVGNTLHHRAWEELDERLTCGITSASAGDFRVPESRTTQLVDTYAALAVSCGFNRVSVPIQAHGTTVSIVDNIEASLEAVNFHFLLAGRVDGQVTQTSGYLLACTAADCVPVYLWHPESDALGLLHAGWRGVSAGILDAGLKALRSFGRDCGTGSESGTGIRLHLGPAICGSCYEVDRQVLGPLGRPENRASLDLRGLLVEQALERGVEEDLITVSAHCTRCGPEKLHSYRRDGQKSGRMAAFLGLRSVATI
jgi:YfiH family protein